MSRSTIRRLLLAAVAGASLVGLTGGPAYAAAAISADPNSGAPLSHFNLRFQNFNDCNPSDPNAENCIVVDFIQGPRVTTISDPRGPNDANGAPDFTSTLQVPPACTATRTTQCSVPGAAIIRAHDSVGDDASTNFTVTGAAPPTTAAPTTTSSTSTSSTSTSTSSTSTTTTSSTSTTSTTEAPTTTTVRPKTKKSSSDNNDDIPRYIAVGLVVLAAAATAAVDTRLRRLR